MRKGYWVEVWRNNRSFEWAHRNRALRVMLTCWAYDLLNWCMWYILRQRCNCAWTYPYGFVPEADCPQHDR